MSALNYSRSANTSWDSFYYCNYYLASIFATFYVVALFSFYVSVLSALIEGNVGGYIKGGALVKDVA